MQGLVYNACFIKLSKTRKISNGTDAIMTGHQKSRGWTFLHFFADELRLICILPRAAVVSLITSTRVRDTFLTVFSLICIIPTLGTMP